MAACEHKAEFRIVVHGIDHIVLKKHKEYADIVIWENRLYTRYI